MINVRMTLEKPVYMATYKTYAGIDVPFLSDLSPELEVWFSMYEISSPILDALTTHDPLHRPLQRLLI